MVIGRDASFYEQTLLKQSFAIYASESKGETFNKQVIQVDVDQPLVNNMYVVPEPQVELKSNIEIANGPDVSGEV